MAEEVAKNAPARGRGGVGELIGGPGARRRRRLALDRVVLARAGGEDRVELDAESVFSRRLKVQRGDLAGEQVQQAVDRPRRLVEVGDLRCGATGETREGHRHPYWESLRPAYPATRRGERCRGSRRPRPTRPGDGDAGRVPSDAGPETVPGRAIWWLAQSKFLPPGPKALLTCPRLLCQS